MTMLQIRDSIQGEQLIWVYVYCVTAPKAERGVQG